MPCNRKLSEHLLAGCDSFIQYTKQLKNKITRPRYQGTKTSNNQKRVAGHLNIVIIIIIITIIVIIIISVCCKGQTQVFRLT